nr:MAG TPA: hypothetical protein [Caudoviricetes sp.]
MALLYRIESNLSILFLGIFLILGGTYDWC